MSELVRNALKTPDGTIIESRHRHDFVTYIDKNGDEEDMCVTTEDSFEKVRHVCSWGTYGINGDQPLQYKAIAEMDTDHIEAVLQTVKHIRPMIKTVMQNELKFRQANVSYE